MRKIFLPSLKHIRIQNYTLYPSGLDFNFDFVNGINLILGGNGMGKTTFVNIVKYAIIGNYKKSVDLTRTYQERAIIKRRQNPSEYFRNRMDRSIIVEQKATVTISFYINETHFTIERCLETITTNSLLINGINIEGEIISQDKYESLKDDIEKERNLEEKEKKRNNLKRFLLHKYEVEIQKCSNLLFDDLIFFINEILFFGENHKTILWDDDSIVNVQDELFNKYFNSPELDKERQEALRLSRYYDSLSRHRSEDIRAINNVLKKINKTKESKGNVSVQIIKLKDDMNKTDSLLEAIQTSRMQKSKNVSIIQNQINELSLLMHDIERKKNIAENKFESRVWQTLHPHYKIFLKNIQVNNICPICNQTNEKLVTKVLDFPEQCFACSTKFKKIEDSQLEEEYKKIQKEYNLSNNKIQNFSKEISQIEKEIKVLDKEFADSNMKKRNLQNNLRHLEFENSKGKNTDELQAFYDEIIKLEKEKAENQEKSRKEFVRAEEISISIESEIIKNVARFSTLFSSFAERFLGVECSLTYDNLEGTKKRFYPVINKTPRKNSEELSESQRFFVDHSFRMSILTFFYTKPAFYIVETPDSSLDISYEENAANVFLDFLKQPNSVIITSNLNNSLFVNHIIDNQLKIPVALIGLLDIAKQSIIQNTSETLISIYNLLKMKIQKRNE